MHINLLSFSGNTLFNTTPNICLSQLVMHTSCHSWSELLIHAGNHAQTLPVVVSTSAMMLMEQLYVHRIQVRHPFIIVPVILKVCLFYSVNVVYDVREVYLLAQDLEQKRLERGNVWAVPFLLQNWHCRTSLWARPTPSTVRNTTSRFYIYTKSCKNII